MRGIAIILMISAFGCTSLSLQEQNGIFEADLLGLSELNNNKSWYEKKNNPERYNIGAILSDSEHINAFLAVIDEVNEILLPDGMI